MEAKIEFTRRLCRVGNRYGLFHTWEFYSQEVMALSPTLHGGVGGPPRRDSQVLLLLSLKMPWKELIRHLLDFVMKITIL